MVQEYLTFSDLSGLNSSPDSVRSKFKEIYGTRPDGIALNDQIYYNAVKPPITQQYSHYCYKRLGQHKFTQRTSDPEKQVIIGSNTARNNSNSWSQINLTVNGTWTEETAWSSSITTGMSFSQEFNIQGVFKIGISFSISATTGKSGSSSVSKSSSASVTVKVPPKSLMQVNMIATIKKETLHFKVPISVEGKFGANFPHPVQGHYFWFRSASEILPTTSGEISGKIEGVTAFNVSTLIGKPMPLS
ncbi:hypothetical protein B4U84_02300 [Westiellopsis prolifica IICB1]|nr:hypothetical protein B4U84_02300 [Westiellopsis prolifica IICB1]